MAERALSVVDVHEAGIAPRSDDWSQARIDVLRQAYFKDATDAEMDLAIATCKRTGLAPEARQIFFLKRWDSKARAEVVTSQVSIDGFRLIAERTGKYAGQLGPAWCGADGRWLDVWLESTPPAAARVGVLRKDWQAPLWAVARWTSYVQTTKDGAPTAMWKKMPDLMLAKAAESLALRRAFPAELSGLYSDAEMDQADNPSPPMNDVVARNNTTVVRPAPVPSAEIIDAETGEIVAPNNDVAYDNTTKTMRALHAALRDKGLTHEDGRVLAKIGYRVDSLKDLDPAQLDDLLTRVRNGDAEHLAGVIAKARGREQPEPEPAPPAEEPAAINDREQRLIEVREMIEGDALRDDHEWATFGEEIGGDSEAWQAAVGAAVTVGQLERLGREARQRGMWSPGFERAYGEREKALIARANQLGR